MKNYTQVLNEQKDSKNPYYKKIKKTLDYLKKKDKILFLTTSNRGEWAIKEKKEEPKSTQLAKLMQKYLGSDKCTLIEVPDLKIYPCEGNVSHAEGNTCGLKKAELKDKDKNPTGYHRCWASINNEDDELWKISKVLFESDCVIFFGSVRWGQMNSFYQRLIERLTWIENRHSSLDESNIIKDIKAGIIVVGQNWRGEKIVDIQMEVLDSFGFDVKSELCWNWQYTDDSDDESLKGYKKSGEDFKEQIIEVIEEINKK